MRSSTGAASAARSSALPGNAGLVTLDTKMTAELAAEGTARDVVRIVQQARRDAKLAVTDRISLTVGADGLVADKAPTLLGLRARRRGPSRSGVSSPA